MAQKSRKQNAFTIVELLITVVVIGILAAIIFVAYDGANQKAVVALLQSDLANSAKKLRLYNTEYGSYPALDGSNCPIAPSVDDRYCLKLSGENLKYSYVYTKDTFTLTIKNGPSMWHISQDSQPEAINLDFSNSGGGLWPFRRTITIENNSGSSLSDFQIQIKPFTVTTFTTNYSSIRFTRSDGTTELPYWQEADNTYWIKYNGSLPPGSTTIYIYYGNPNATSSSNGDDVFILYEDFSSSTVNTSKWTTTGTPELSGGSLVINSLSEGVTSVAKINAASSVAELRAMRTATAGYASFTIATNNCSMTNWWFADAVLYLVKSGSSCNFISDKGASLGSYSANSWHTFKFINTINSGNHYVDSYVDGYQKTTNYNTGNTGNLSLGSIRFSAHPSVFSGTYYVDYVRVRNYIAVEPNHNAPLAEEAL